MRVAKAEFLRGAARPDQLPDWPEREVAVVGRSNVGKSTFINNLTGVKKLARASSTPGRTTELNCFKITFTQGKPLVLVDLPGYGYAKLSRAARAGLSDTIVGYLEQRTQLRLILLLLDVRRDPEDDERDILELARLRDIPVRVVLTKVDKLTRNELSKSTKAHAAALEITEDELMLSGTDRSLAPLWNAVAGLAV